MAQPKRRGRPSHDDVLTPAEWRVVHGVQHGLPGPALAQRLSISGNMVKFHVGNALSKRGMASRRELRHWFAIPRASALNQGESIVNTTLELGPLGQVSRSVGDIGRSAAFWRDTLGVPHLYTYGKLAFFDLGGTRLMLTEKEGGAADESILYLRVADIVAAHAQLCARGVRFTGAPHRIFTHPDGTEEWMAFFSDPDDRPVAIMAQVARVAGEGSVLR